MPKAKEKKDGTAPGTGHVYCVDPERITKGDIEKAYSADRIAEGKGIRKPFEYDGKKLCVIGLGPGAKAEAYELVPEKEYGGPTYPYANYPGIGYDGMLVSFGKEKFVLKGPELKFEGSDTFFNDVEIDDIASEAVIAELNGHTPDLRLIELDSLYKSNTNPRKRFPEASIEELATSIREKGILEPLIVRVKTDLSHGNSAFEIVCGERRYRAAMRADLKVAPCLVRELTDDEVLDIQIHENLHREDVHPMDEAYGYKFLQEKLQCDVAELALRVGKNERYVHTRLRLNDLIAEIRDDIEANIFPMTFGLELAKFDPVTQKQIYDQCFDAVWDSKVNGRVPDKQQLRRWGSVANYINSHVMFELAKAPFDKKSTELRSDGLACVKCPERTGAAKTLFPAEEVGKKDRCLNPTCFQAKTERHVTLAREKIAKEAKIDVNDVPLVNPRRRSWEDYGDGILNSGQYRKVDAKDAAKPGVIMAVNVSPDNYGEPIYIKKIEKKAEHSDKREPGQAKSEKELEQFRQRKEELFDQKVGNIVRYRVFKQAAEIFGNQFAVTGGSKRFLPELLAKLWATSNNGNDSQTLHKIVDPILNEWLRELNIESEEDDHTRSYGRERASTFAKYADFLQNRILFLFVHGNRGAMYFGNASSQKPVRDLAEEYGINYRLIDAQVRLEHCSKKYRSQFESYLRLVEEGSKDPLIPLQWAMSYDHKETFADDDEDED